MAGENPANAVMGTREGSSGGREKAVKGSESGLEGKKGLRGSEKSGGCVSRS